MAAIVSLPFARAKSVRVPSMSSRPFPHVRSVDASSPDLDWDPVARELFSVTPSDDGSIEGAPYVRAGEAFAIVRPGYERWPLGIASDHYRVTSHRATNAAILAACSTSIEPNGRVVSGHGYHVAHGYFVRHAHAASIDGVKLASKLVVANDHTGAGALRAAMVLYLGGDDRGRGGEPIGSLVRSRGLHVGAQPEHWQGTVDAMIEQSILAQDAVIDVLRAAAARVLDDADRAFLRRADVIVKENAHTALDAVLIYHRGFSRQTISWGVWERRLDDHAIYALCGLLGREKFGNPIDAVLGRRRFGKY